MLRKRPKLISNAPSKLSSETTGAVTNLGTRTVAENSELFAKLRPGDGMSGVFDHSSGNLILRPSSDVLNPLPKGWVRQTGGHADVRVDLGTAIGEDLSTCAKGRLSGFAIIKEADGTIAFKWNSGQINPGSHGARAVPESLRPAIEEAVKKALGFKKMRNAKMKYSIPKLLTDSFVDGSWRNVPPDVLRRCLGDELDDLQLYENASIMHMIHANLDEAGYVDDPEFCMTRKDDPTIDDPRLMFPRALFIGGSKIPGDDVFAAIQQDVSDDHDPSVWVLDWSKSIPYRWAERGRLSGLISCLRLECEKNRKV